MREEKRDGVKEEKGRQCERGERETVWKCQCTEGKEEEGSEKATGGGGRRRRAAGWPREPVDVLRFR